jgi:cysteine desulfuration protein SufE
MVYFTWILIKHKDGPDMEESLTLQALEENFSLFDDWEEKYTYLIDMGKKIDGLDDVFKIPAYKIDGCTSNVWLVPKRESNGAITFQVDSDAIIVRGLIAILLIAYNGKTIEEIRQTDIKGFFVRVGLESHLSPNRRNGFFSMVERISSL